MKRILMLIITAAMLLAPLCAQAQTLTCIVSESQYVNVRKQPRSDASSWGKLHNGDTIEPESVTGGWIEFSFSGKKAYVSVKFFEEDGGGLYTVSANGRVRVRNAPNGERVDWAEPGETVSVEGWRYGTDGALWARCGSWYIAAEYLAPM